MPVITLVVLNQILLETERVSLALLWNLNFSIKIDVDELKQRELVRVEVFPRELR